MWLMLILLLLISHTNTMRRLLLLRLKRALFHNAGYCQRILSQIHMLFWGVEGRQVLWGVVDWGGLSIAKENASSSSSWLRALADPKRTCGYHYSQGCNVCNRDTENIMERSDVDEWTVAAGGEGKLSRRIWLIKEVCLEPGKEFSTCYG